VPKSRCEDVNRVQADVEYDFVYVDQESFEKYKPTSFKQVIDGFREYKEKIQPANEPDGNHKAQ